MDEELPLLLVLRESYSLLACISMLAAHLNGGRHIENELLAVFFFNSTINEALDFPKLLALHVAVQ